MSDYLPLKARWPRTSMPMAPSLTKALLWKTSPQTSRCRSRICSMKLLRPQVKEANVNWLIIVGTHIPGNTIGKGSLHLCNCVSTLTFIFFLPAFCIWCIMCFSEQCCWIVTLIITFYSFTPLICMRNISYCLYFTVIELHCFCTYDEYYFYYDWLTE